MIWSTVQMPDDKSMYLFDTFAGIPSSNLTEAEQTAGFAGRLNQASVDEVRTRLLPWMDKIYIVAGDVFDTVGETETGPLAFVHLDLNAAAASRLALEYAWPRMTTGGILVLDDYGYGYDAYVDQRKAVDGFFAEVTDTLIALPTGQAIAIKK